MNLLPMKENYDGSTQEPVTFLPLIPLVLLNGVSGIAVGWSTDILPRSLTDLKQAVIDVLDGKEPKEIKPTYSYLNVTTKKLEENSWEFTGKIEYIDTSTLRIVELPPEVDFEKFKDKLDKMQDAGTIVDYEDNSTKTIDITIKFKRGSLKDYVEDDYLNLLKLKTKKTERIVVLDWNGKSIRQYDSATKLIKDFVAWRFNYYVERYKVQLQEREADLQYVLALKDCYEQGLPNEALKLKDKKAIDQKVRDFTKTRTITDSDVDRIVSLPIYRWTVEYYNKLKEEEKDLIKEIAYIKSLLAKPALIKNIYKDEVKAIG
jgi:DNA gyrase/topoisomerase IV subunit A